MTAAEWFPTECAPRRFPVHLIRGALMLPGGAVVAMPEHRDAANGWGVQGSLHVVEPYRKPLPTALALRWFSYTEDRFYEGRFDLPTERLQALFAAGLPQARLTAGQAAFDRLIVGMAPQGFVAVWVAGDGEVCELAHFRAAEAQLPWTSVAGDSPMSRAAFIADTLRELSTPEDQAARARPTPHGDPYRAYARYHERFRWQPRARLSGQALWVNIASFNGENARLSSKGAAVPTDTRPVPSVIEVAWTPPNGAPQRAIVTLDEAEVFAAFAKLSPGQSRKALTLVIDTGVHGADVSLQDGEVLLPLKAAKSRIRAL